jgi:hypothetical protein
MRTNDFLKDFPPERQSWAGKVTFSFSYPESGWIQWAITCTTFVQNVVISCSHAFDPFPQLFQWLEAIAAGRLPAETFIDEEGRVKLLRALPVSQDEFVFEILEKYWDKDTFKEQPIFLYTQVTRKQFLAEFVKAWEDFMSSRYDPGEWGPHGTNLSKLELSKLRAFLEE